MKDADILTRFYTISTPKEKRAYDIYRKPLISLVGTAGFEPATTCPPDKCATRLRYAPSILKKNANLISS